MLAPMRCLVCGGVTGAMVTLPTLDRVTVHLDCLDALPTGVLVQALQTAIGHHGAAAIAGRLRDLADDLEALDRRDATTAGLLRALADEIHPPGDEGPP